MTTTNESNARPSPYMPMFEHFRQELDEHHDRRERIIKASRDVTAASKKIIFTLQRIRKLGEPLPEHVNKSNKQYYDTIKINLSKTAPEVQDVNYYRYARQFTSGLQEYMEAIIFEHYLTTASILTYEEANAAVQQISTTDSGTFMTLTHEDYVLGLLDMTGELMRFSITAMATHGALPTTAEDSDRNVLTDLRDIRSALETLEAGSGPFAKDCEKKMSVMKQSVEKVERSLYGLRIRGAERPKGWMPDLQTIDVES